MTIKDRVWIDQAACRNLPKPAVADFFPPAQENGHPSGRAYITIRDAGYARAQAICNTCPVRTDCLKWANDTKSHEESDGVLGGETPHQRRKRLKMAERTWSVDVDVRQTITLTVQAASRASAEAAARAEIRQLDHDQLPAKYRVVRWQVDYATAHEATS